jgi:ribosomal protein S12 methylthiotransferase
MANQLTEAVKKKRRDRAMAEQLKVAQSVAQSFVGREIRVLIEKQASSKDLQQANISSWEHGLIRSGTKSGTRGARPSGLIKGKYLVARGESDAPDIDGRVYIAGSKLPVGEFATVKVIGHTDYDLIAK